MKAELADEGYLVHMVAINAISATAHQGGLIENASFPLFQDTPEVDAWGLHGGRKDDIIIYDAEGSLHTSLPNGGELTTNLGTNEGYANVWNALVEASGPGPAP